MLVRIWEKEPSYTVGGNVTAMELSMEVLGKTNSDDDDGDNYNGT
jgi:hypothetical protein